MSRNNNRAVWVVFGPQGQEINRFQSQQMAEAVASKIIGATVRYVGP